VFATSAMAGNDRSGVAIEGLVGGNADLIGRQAVAVAAVALLSVLATSLCLLLVQLRLTSQRGSMASTAKAQPADEC
jgi:hypothetical protein